MTYKQIQLMQKYLIKQGYALAQILHMTVPQLIDKYYEEKGVSL